MCVKNYVKDWGWVRWVGGVGRVLFSLYGRVGERKGSRVVLRKMYFDSFWRWKVCNMEIGIVC